MGRAVITDSQIALTVSTTGNDDTTPGQVASGNLSATPYRTLAKALSALPVILKDNVTVTVGAGTFTGVSISGFQGGKITEIETIGLYIEGTYANVTPTTGVASGTAGSGTNTTTLVKPTGAANWTASDLKGKFLLLTGGGGSGNYPVVRAILENTTSNITVRAVTGMDSTTTFRIVEPSTYLKEATNDDVALRISYNSAPITVRGLRFTSANALTSLIASVGNNALTIDGCLFDFSTDEESVYSNKDGDFLISNCIFKSATDMLVENCARYVEGRALYASIAGMLEFDKCLAGKMQANIGYSIGVGFRAAAMNSLQAEIASEQCEDTPVQLESIGYFEAVGDKLTGTNNVTYGLEINKAGFYSLTGSTISGADGDVMFMGTEVTWANLASATYGLAEWHTGSATAYATVAKALKYGNYLFDGSIDVSGRLLLYGYFNQSANLAAVVLNSATPYNMETNGVRGVLEANSTSALAAVVLPSNAAICGVIVTICNVGSQIITAQAPSGGAITGSAVVSAGTAAQFVSLNTANGKDYMRIS